MRDFAGENGRYDYRLEVELIQTTHARHLVRHRVIRLSFMHCAQRDCNILTCQKQLPRSSGSHAQRATLPPPSNRRVPVCRADIRAGSATFENTHERRDPMRHQVLRQTAFSFDTTRFDCKPGETCETCETNSNLLATSKCTSASSCSVRTSVCICVGGWRWGGKRERVCVSARVKAFSCMCVLKLQMYRAYVCVCVYIYILVMHII